MHAGGQIGRRVLSSAAGFDFGQSEESNYFCAGEKGYHRQWDSRLFNYRNWEVLRYLLSNLSWWISEYRRACWRLSLLLGCRGVFCASHITQDVNCSALKALRPSMKNRKSPWHSWAFVCGSIKLARTV